MLDYEKADELRKQIEEKGFKVVDTKDTTYISKQGYKTLKIKHMPKTKTEIKKVHEKNVQEELIAMLKVEIPTIFDRTPTGSMAQTGLEKIAKRIVEICL